MIIFDNVSFSYGKTQIIEKISFRVALGEFVAIVGPNGAGKTTVSKLARGLLRPTSGTVTIDALNTRTTKASKIARTTGFLFQNPDRQICQNTVRDEIAFNLKIQGKSDDETTSRVEELISLFGFDPNASPFRLSRGERQRLALASALSAKPKILILDEPTTGLDYRECMKIMNLIKSENLAGTTVFMICHDMEIVSDFAERILVIADGRLIADGNPDTIFFNKEICAKAALLPPQIAELSQRLGGAYQGIRHVDNLFGAIRKNFKGEATL